MSVAIKELKGVAPELATKLNEKGIKTSDQLLDAAKTASARQELAKQLGADKGLILELANRADLARIKGVAGVYADLLENAGVDTVKELAVRKPDNLFNKLTEVNNTMKLTSRAPTQDMVSDWVNQAKELPKTLEY